MSSRQTEKQLCRQKYAARIERQLNAIALANVVAQYLCRGVTNGSPTQRRQQGIRSHALGAGESALRKPRSEPSPGQNQHRAPVESRAVSSPQEQIKREFLLVGPRSRTAAAKAWVVRSLEAYDLIRQLHEDLGFLTTKRSMVSRFARLCRARNASTSHLYSFLDPSFPLFLRYGAKDWEASGRSVPRLSFCASLIILRHTDWWRRGISALLHSQQRLTELAKGSSYDVHRQPNCVLDSIQSFILARAHGNLRTRILCVAACGSLVLMHHG